MRVCWALVSDGDRSAAVGALLRAAGGLAAIALGLGGLAGAGAGWAASRGALASAVVLAADAAVLLACGAFGVYRLSRLAHLGFCGLWHAHLAARLLRLQVVALVAGGALAAIGTALG